MCVAHSNAMCHTYYMSDTFRVQVGERGRVVIPAEIRARHRWAQGTPLVAVDTEHGVQLMAQEDVLSALQGALRGKGTVEEFLSERRTAAAAE